MCNIHSPFLSHEDPSRALDRANLRLEARDDVRHSEMVRLAQDTSVALEHFETEDSVLTTSEEVLVNG